MSVAGPRCPAAQVGLARTLGVTRTAAAYLPPSSAAPRTRLARPGFTIAPVTAPTTPSLDLDLLEQAVEWVSGGIEFGNAAYVSRESGRIVWVGDGVEDQEEDLEDLEDGTLYLSVPHKNDLDLGKTLVLRFADEHLGLHAAEVHDIFRRRGAYGRFKHLLERRSLLEDWYAYSNAATQQALEQWAKDNGFNPVLPAPRRQSDA